MDDDCGFGFSVASLIKGQERLMTKFVTGENWFIKNVVSEICQNLHVTRDHDLPAALLATLN